jgi:hypothetical protein
MDGSSFVSWSSRNGDSMFFSSLVLVKRFSCSAQVLLRRKVWDGSTTNARPPHAGESRGVRRVTSSSPWPLGVGPRNRGYAFLNAVLNFKGSKLSLGWIVLGGAPLDCARAFRGRAFGLGGGASVRAVQLRSSFLIYLIPSACVSLHGMFRAQMKCGWQHVSVLAF